MQICKFTDGKLTDIRDMPTSYRNVSNPTLSTIIPDGWREYCPSAVANIRASHWEDDGRAVRQVVDSVWTAEELAAQAQEKAEQAAADRLAWEAELAAQAAALKALESELDNANRITRSLALTILDELNRIATRIRAFDAAVAAASSLADLKIRAAALSAIPDRTVEQFKTAVRNRAQELP